MAINNARRFVKKLRHDQNFRKKALATAEPEDLPSLKRVCHSTKENSLRLWLNAWSNWSYRRFRGHRFSLEDILNL